MAGYKIAVIPGDDSGPEVMESAIKILERVARNSSLKFDFAYEEVGAEEIRGPGRYRGLRRSKFGGISQATADRIKQCQALLYTAVAASKLPRHVKTPWPFLLKYLNTFVNIRPGKSYPIRAPSIPTSISSSSGRRTKDCSTPTNSRRRRSRLFGDPMQQDRNASRRPRRLRDGARPQQTAQEGERDQQSPVQQALLRDLSGYRL